jgi:hypothetical protein
MNLVEMVQPEHPTCKLLPWCTITAVGVQGRFQESALSHPSSARIALLTLRECIWTPQQRLRTRVQEATPRSLSRGLLG